MEPKTLKLLSCLRENSREKLTTISKKTAIPISTLFEILKELQDSLITKNTILLDYEKLGYHARAQIFLRVNREDRDILRKHLNLHPSVNTIYKVNNHWDFIAETVHHNIKELDEFLDNLTQKFKVEQKEIHYLIDEIKKEGFLLA